VRDRRTVDELSVEELEHILAIKKRQAREATLRRLKGAGRLVDVDAVEEEVERTRSNGAASTAPAGSRYRTQSLDTPPKRLRLSINWRWLRDQALLLVEIGAVAGLILLFVDQERRRQENNREAVAAQSVNRPTPVPTPLIQAVVLPSGHKPPDASGASAPNPDEIPAHLRSYVQSVTPLPIPTPGPGQPTRIVIKAIGVDAGIVPGTDWEQLKKGIGHQPGSANPGERGNLVLAAHNDIFGEIFRDLDQLQPGDEIIVYSIDRSFRYVVTETRLVAPTDVEVMHPTSEPTVTLISCYPYRVDTQRIVVIASLGS